MHAHESLIQYKSDTPQADAKNHRLFKTYLFTLSAEEKLILEVCFA